MNKILITGLAAVTLAAGTLSAAAPAMAYDGYGYGHRDDSGAAVGAALLGGVIGLAVGSSLAQPYPAYGYAEPAYGYGYAPAPAYAYPEPYYAPSYGYGYSYAPRYYGYGHGYYGGRGGWHDRGWHRGWDRR